MLSNISIKKFIDSGDIIVDPWDDSMLDDGARIPLQLGERILIPQGDIVIDVVKKTLPEYEEVLLTPDKPFRLEPGMFVLGETYEKIGLSEKVCMLLDGRSTLARLGLMVVQTAMIVDPGQQPKKMTLEIKNNGPHAIMLYPKMKFCRACCFELNPPATIRHDSATKYHPGDSNKPIFTNEIKG